MTASLIETPDAGEWMRFVVAPRREARNLEPLDWYERLRVVQGVSVVAASPLRAQIMATSTGIERLHAILGERYLIEELIEHVARY